MRRKVLGGVDEFAEQGVAVEETQFGRTYDAGGFETHASHAAVWWQTTVPYWVELLGSVDEWEHPTEYRNGAPSIIEWAGQVQSLETPT